MSCPYLIIDSLTRGSVGIHHVMSGVGPWGRGVSINSLYTQLSEDLAVSSIYRGGNGGLAQVLVLHAKKEKWIYSEQFLRKGQHVEHSYIISKF